MANSAFSLASPVAAWPITLTPNRASKTMVRPLSLKRVLVTSISPVKSFDVARSGGGCLPGAEPPVVLFASHGHDFPTVGKHMGGVSAGVLGKQRLRFFGC